MATTFSRMMAALREATGNDSWSSMQELVSAIQEHMLVEFRLRSEGSLYMGEKSTRGVLELMRDLELLKENAGGTVSVTSKGRDSLSSSDAFARQVRSSVKTYLDQRGLPLSEVVKCIKNIKLPEVPNIDTIFEDLPDPKPDLTREGLRKILFLLACADGIGRVVRVHYTEK